MLTPWPRGGQKGSSLVRLPAWADPGTRPALSIGHGPVARPGISVRDAGELLARVLQLAGPLAGQPKARAA